MAEKVAQVKLLFKQVYFDHSYSKHDELNKLMADMRAEGYRFEHGYGYYLHTPEGEVITLDDWNEVLDK